MTFTVAKMTSWLVMLVLLATAPGAQQPVSPVNPRTRAVVVTDQNLTLMWTQPDLDCSLPVDEIWRRGLAGFDVYMGTVATVLKPIASLPIRCDLPNAEQAYTFRVGAPGQTYYFRVRATGINGSSPLSAMVSGVFPGTPLAVAIRVATPEPERPNPVLRALKALVPSGLVSNKPELLDPADVLIVHEIGAPNDDQPPAIEIYDGYGLLFLEEARDDAPLCIALGFDQQTGDPIKRCVTLGDLRRWVQR